MADTDIGLQIPITADTNPFKAAMNGIQNSMSASMEGVKNSLDNVKTSFGAVGLMAADYLKGAVASATSAQKANSDIEQTIKSTGSAAGMTAKQVEDMASGFSKVSLFGGSAIKTGDAMLLTFTNIGKDVLPLATDAMLNMATKMKTDPVNSAIQLGKALNDPEKGLTALTRVGVTFTDQQKEQIKAMQESGDMAGAQKVILAELSKEFGGQALAATKTYDGQMQMMKKSLDGVKTSVGMAVLPALQQMAGVIQSIITPITSFLQKNSQLTAIILSLTAAIGTFVGGASLVQKVMTIMGPVVSGLGTALAGMLGPVLAIVAGIAALGYAYATNFMGMKNIVDSFVQTTMKFLIDGFNAARNAVLFLMDGFKGVGDPDALGGWQLAVYNTGASFKTAFEVIKSAVQVGFAYIQQLWNSVLKPVLGFIVQELGVVVDWVKANWPLIKNTVEIVFNAIKSVVTTIINAVYSVIKSVVGFIVDFWKDHWETIKTVLQNDWDIIKTVVDTVIHVILDLIKVVMDIINGNWSQAWTDLVDAVKRIFNGAIQIVKDILGNIGTVFSDMVKTAITWGENLINGFIQGIKNKIQAVRDAAASVMAAAKGFLGFNSPSREGEGQHIVEWGSNMISGFMDGVKSQIPNLQTLMSGVIKAPNLMTNVGSISSGSLSLGSSSTHVINQYSFGDISISAKDLAEVKSITDLFNKLKQTSRSRG